jgi:hypothetical protein
MAKKDKHGKKEEQSKECRKGEEAVRAWMRGNPNEMREATKHMRKCKQCAALQDKLMTENCEGIHGYPCHKKIGETHR